MSALVKPLNPALYRQLQRVFGRVKIANEGIPFKARIVRDPTRRGRVGFEKDGEFGEYYQVCCPLCSDERYRCWVNHRWGSPVLGVKTNYLCVCYNESCHEGGKLDRWLERNLSGYIGRKYRVSQERVEPKAEVIREVHFPTNLTRLTDLPPDHPGIAYLRDVRKLSVRDLDLVWGVRWVNYDAELPAHHRFFFPVYAREEGEVKMVGYQTRFFDISTGSAKPPDNNMKWYTPTGMRRSRVVYNGYRVTSKLVVPGEGPLDAIGIGSGHGLAFFGKNVSAFQRKLLWNNWGSLGGVMVLALDPDVWDRSHADYEKFVEMEAQFKHAWRGYVRLDLGDRDPGETPRAELWDCVAKALGSIGLYREFKDEIVKAALTA